MAGLSSKDRDHIIAAAVEILRHRRRHQLLRILEARLRQGDYGDDSDTERRRDRVTLAVARTIDRMLDEEPP